MGARMLRGLLSSCVLALLAACAVTFPEGANYACQADADCGTGRCVKGSGERLGVCCTPTGAEVCDGTDNDCDGVVDELDDVTCYTGPAGTEGVGRCTAGQARCADASTQVCEGDIHPATEVCNGQDDDCDGRIDQTFDLARDRVNCGACGNACTRRPEVRGWRLCAARRADRAAMAWTTTWTGAPTVPTTTARPSAVARAAAARAACGRSSSASAAWTRTATGRSTARTPTAQGQSCGVGCVCGGRRGDGDRLRRRAGQRWRHQRGLRRPGLRARGLRRPAASARRGSGPRRSAVGGLDEDGDGAIDCADPDCNTLSCGEGCLCQGGGRTELTCAGGLDEDGDGAIDCADPDCDALSCGDGCVCAGGTASELTCAGGMDEDGDGAIDCADPDCDALSCGDGCVCQGGTGKELLCTGGIDEDGDGAIDCADSDCETLSCGDGCVCQGGRGKELICTGGVDEDGDGAIDCADTDCEALSCGIGCTCSGGVGVETACVDNRDNDGDSRIDCADSDCDGSSCGTACVCFQLPQAGDQLQGSRGQRRRQPHRLRRHRGLSQRRRLHAAEREPGNLQQREVQLGSGGRR